jgi:Prenyltransferase and squalene oxidase repeat
VRLRVEGRVATLFDGSITSDARPLDGGDGTGPHACGSSGPAPLTAVADAGLGWRGGWNPDFQDFFVDLIGPDGSDDATASYWGVLVDWRYVAGGCRASAAPGAEVLWAYGAERKAFILRLAGPSRAAVGETVTVTVRDGRIRPAAGTDGGPVMGAVVGGVATDAEGHARLRYDTAGLRLLKAEHPDGIRSNALALCVGDAACQGAALPPPTAPVPTPSGPAIAKIRPGERFARGAGPRILRGRAGGSAVELALARRTGRGCDAWDAGRRMLAARRCGTAPEPFKVAVRDVAWRYALGRDLPPGRYTLTAVGSALQPARVSFTVAARPRTQAAAARAAASYLSGARARGGGFGASPGARPSALVTGWAALALGRASPEAAALRSARRVLRGRALRPRALPDLERSVLALAGSPRAADRRAAARWRMAIARRQRANGSFAGNVNLTAFGILALQGSRRLAAHRRRARRWLRPRQLADGGFPLSARTADGDVDTTGAVLWALGRSGRRTVARRASAFLPAAQSPSGGLGTRPGEEPNSQSTALAAIGMRAAGLSPERMRTEDGISPLDYLRAQARRDGSVSYDLRSNRTPVWVTAQALLALAGPRR